LTGFFCGEGHQNRGWKGKAGGALMGKANKGWVERPLEGKKRRGGSIVPHGVGKGKKVLGGTVPAGGNEGANRGGGTTGTAGKGAPETRERGR